MGQAVSIVFGTVLPWLLVAFGCWLLYQLVAQNGRILLRLESLETRLGAPATPASAVPPSVDSAPSPEGLAVGVQAPAFELADLAGTPRSLGEFLGRKVLLVFFGPRCGYCVQMLPKLAQMKAGASGNGIVPLVVTSGSLEENVELFREYGVEVPVLLQKQLEVAAKYQAYGTPVGYLIDESGKIASSLAMGADAVLALAGPPIANGRTREKAHDGEKKYAGNRPLESSRLIRDGLKAGTQAPGFRLPKVGGGELELASYIGRRVLLVFSDPQCGPCDALAPRLEEIHRASDDPQVVMISRRDMDSNRKKVAELSLSFPVGVQKNWDTSRAYGMFATPIAYLIDEHGVIAADVAVGAEAIIALAQGEPASGVCTEGDLTRELAASRG